jgi:hypothetical protein
MGVATYGCETWVINDIERKKTRSLRDVMLKADGKDKLDRAENE